MANDDRPSRALSLSQPHPDLPAESEWNLMQRMCKAFHESGLYPNIKNVAQAIAIVQTGRELGIPPSTALREFAIIGGKPAASAGILAGLCQRDHGSLALRVTEYEDDHCTVEFARRGWPAASRVTFTMADAKKAGLLDPQQTRNGVREPNPNWFKFPRSMLRSRAISEAARTAFQDSILGLYSAEELAPDLVTVTEDGEVVLDDVIEVTPEPEQATPAPAQAASAEPVEDEAAAKSLLAVEIQDLCATLGRDAPTSVRDWVTLGTNLGLPAITKSSQMSVEWFEQIKARLQPIGKSTAYVKWESVITKATARHDVVAALDDAMLDLSEEEYAQLDALADARFESLPEEAEAVTA